VRARVVELYKRGPASDLRRLLDAASAREAMRAWRQMAAASSRDAARFADHRRAVAGLAASRADLEKQRVEAARQREAAGVARAALDRSIRAHRNRVDAIRQEKALNAALTAELKNAAAGLAKTVESLPAPAGTPAAAPITAFRRALPWPAAGKVARTFRSETPGSLPFNGVEIAVDDGAPVAVVHEGEVAFSGPYTGFGHLIIVQHAPETFTVYGHLRVGHVARGDRVNAGQVIGRAGQPPGSRESRLYFELRVDGQPVNPLQWLRAQ
jgi:septal ring factor EnvC (AmiA/AmiB activator)